MEEKRNKCPLCSKKLVMKDGVPTCPDCGYRDPYRSGGQQGYSQPNYGQQPSQGGNGQPNYGQPSQGGNGQSNYGQPSQGRNGQPNYGQPSQGGNGRPNYGQPSQGGNGQSNYGQPSQGGNGQPNYGQPSQGGNGQRLQMGPYAAVVSPSGEASKKTNATTIAVIIIAILVAVLMSVSVIAGLVNSGLFADGRGGAEGNSQRESGITSYSSQTDNQGTSSSSRQSVSDVSHLTFSQPESELLQEFVSQLFGKPAASATRGDLNSVVRVEVHTRYDFNGTEIDYELSDGTAGTCYLSSTRVDPEDFKCFPEIQTLDLGRNSLDWDTDWHNLTSLTSLTCETTLEELAKYMDVSQLTSLSLSPGFFMRDLSGLEAYSSLEYLKLDCGSSLSELTGLSRAAALTTLVIEDGDLVTDYGELYNMPQMKGISIESDGLRDIGFISGMTGLESLELVSTQLLQVDAIADRADSLKCLRLHQNYAVEDYSAVFECTGLEELELYVNYDFDVEMAMPDLSMMSGLKVLTLGNYEKFPGLEDLTSLESLTLVGGGFYGNDGGLENLEKLTGLKSLSLIDVSTKPQLLETFAAVDSLETINLEDTFVWGSLNAVFGMPNLKTLILDDVDFGLMLDGMPVSESLQELEMKDTHVHYLLEDGSFDMRADNTRIELGQNTEFFGHMPNLAILTVHGQELQDVEFAGDLAQLAYLDITDNYVTDLSPLAGLELLKVVICDNNPVNDRTGLKDMIIID